MAPAEKVFALRKREKKKERERHKEHQPTGAREEGRGAGYREVEAEEEEGVQGRKTPRREDRGRSGEEGLKLLADISSGEQAR